MAKVREISKAREKEEEQKRDPSQAVWLRTAQDRSHLQILTGNMLAK